MSTNDGGHAVRMYAGGPIDDEMDSYDRLGPLTRRTIQDLPVRYSAAALITQIEQIRIERGLIVDPKNPQIDASIAGGLRDQCFQTILYDRSEEDAQAGIRPLFPKISVKSIREQRRVLRNLRCR